jgi:hypothetical protein
MPSSFSRFLSDEELQEVQRLYQESLELTDSAAADRAEPIDGVASAPTEGSPSWDQSQQ